MYRLINTLFCLNIALFMALGNAVQAKQWPLDDRATKQWLTASPGFSEGIRQAFAHHQVVAVGDYHWNDKVMLRINELINEPRFFKQVKHVVVEFGNARYQAQLDLYLNGETQDEGILNKVRRDALFFTAWMPDVYADFFRIVRHYNLGVKDEDKVKVWLAESPIYWEKIETKNQWQTLADNKTAGFFDTVQQAISTGDKVFMVFGAFHILNTVVENQTAALPLVTLLKQAYPQQIFTLWPITDPKINAVLTELVAPSILMTNVPQAEQVKLVDILPKAKMRLARLGHEHASVNVLVDALLYVGESKIESRFPASIMHDAAWLTEMDRRLNLVGGRALTAFQQIMANSQLK